jgi:hypothetical protein
MVIDRAGGGGVKILVCLERLIIKEKKMGSPNRVGDSGQVVVSEERQFEHNKDKYGAKRSAYALYRGAHQYGNMAAAQLARGEEPNVFVSNEKGGAEKVEREDAILSAFAYNYLTKAVAPDGLVSKRVGNGYVKMPAEREDYIQELEKLIITFANTMRKVRGGDIRQIHGKSTGNKPMNVSPLGMALEVDKEGARLFFKMVIEQVMGYDVKRIRLKREETHYGQEGYGDVSTWTISPEWQ